MKLWILISCMALTAACSNSSSGDKSPGSLPPIEGKLKDKSGQCNAIPAANPSIYITGWEINSLKDDGTEITTKMYFYEKSISLFTFCQRKGLSAFAQATSDAIVSDTNFQILTSSYKEDKKEKNGFELKCVAQLNAGNPIAYNFTGSCLQINDATGTRTYNPR